jgi:hypothetical protein
MQKCLVKAGQVPDKPLIPIGSFDVALKTLNLSPEVERANGYRFSGTQTFNVSNCHGSHLKILCS